MPEGHILHRLARDQQPLVSHLLSVCSPQGRFSDGAATLDGDRLEAVEAYGKHIHHRFASGAGLHVHLGMQGKWFRLAASQPPRAQVRLRLAGTDAAWDLIAPTTCELMDADAWLGLTSTLGPDPLREDGDPEQAWKNVHAAAGPIGAVLLDQSLIAGVGNVFRAEALFVLGINPHRAAASLARSEFDALWQTLVAMMSRAVDDGRIVTVPHAVGDELPPEQVSRMVYKQSSCRQCGTAVETSSIGGRTAYSCPRCQVG